MPPNDVRKLYIGMHKNVHKSNLLDFAKVTNLKNCKLQFTILYNRHWHRGIRRVDIYLLSAKRFRICCLWDWFSLKTKRRCSNVELLSVITLNSPLRNWRTRLHFYLTSDSARVLCKARRVRKYTFSLQIFK